MDGWIILDKPSGMTSRRAGHIIFSMFGAKTFGHIGTLDPMASGILPIAMGDATKMIPFWSENQPKEYLFGVQFGFETDTLDITGKVKSAKRKVEIIPTIEQIKVACEKLVGEIEQTPPAYSAVHVGGRRAYELARAGKSFEIPPRRVTIYELEYMGLDDKSHQFRVVCTPGTYVRSIARDIAKICGTVATVDTIRRIRTNGLDIKDTVKLDFLENLYNNGGHIKEYLMPVDFGLGDIPVLNLDDNDADVYKHGGFVPVTSYQLPMTSGLHRIYHNDKFIGTGVLDDGVLKPKRVLNN